MQVKVESDRHNPQNKPRLFVKHGGKLIFPLLFFEHLLSRSVEKLIDRKGM